MLTEQRYGTKPEIRHQATQCLFLGEIRQRVKFAIRRLNELCHAKLPISGEISGTEEPLPVSNQAWPSRKPFHPQKANAIEAQKGKRYEAQDPQEERFAATIVLEFDA